jgi:hypothetical protein
MLTYSHAIESRRVSVKFNAKPPERIRTMLKAHGFRWSPGDGLWWRSRVQGSADFLLALDKVLNRDRPDGACWRCKDPKGFFRRFGAATPVYCEACYQAARDHQHQHGTFPADAQAARPYVDPGDRSDLDYEDRCREACGL